jgi:hypothetical protein
VMQILGRRRLRDRQKIQRGSCTSGWPAFEEYFRPDKSRAEVESHLNFRVSSGMANMQW